MRLVVVCRGSRVVVFFKVVKYDVLLFLRFEERWDFDFVIFYFGLSYALILVR